MSLLVVALVSLALVPLEWACLRWLERGRPRSRTLYGVALGVGIVVLAIVSSCIAVAAVGQTWAVVVSGPILAGPFLWWVFRGAYRASSTPAT